MTTFGYLLIGFVLGLAVGCVFTSLNARSDSRRRRGELSRRSLDETEARLRRSMIRDARDR